MPSTIRLEDIYKAQGLVEAASDNSHIYDALNYAWDPNFTGAAVTANPCSEIMINTGRDSFYNKLPEKCPSGFASGGVVSNHHYLIGDGMRENCVKASDLVSGSITADKIVSNSIPAIRINMRNKFYKRDYDQNTLTIEVPGIAKDEIEVFTQGRLLYVKIRDESPIVETITDEDTVGSVKLDLGVLIVVVDKAEKRKLFEIE